jgi:hypothetical protein
MAVASKVPLGVALSLALIGCAGNVVEGLRRDSGLIPEDEVPAQPEGDGGPSGAKDGGAVLRDATLPSTPADAGNATPKPDAAAPAPADAGNAAPPDAGQPPQSGTALNGPALARPTNNGRTYSATVSDWMGAPRCPSEPVFCDDFESQQPGGFAGQAWTLSGTAVTTSDDQPFRGTKSMRFGPPSGMPGQMLEQQTFPMLKDKIFGRMFVYFYTDLPTAPSDAHWTLVEVGGDDPANKGQVRLGGQIDPSRNNKNFFGVGSDGGDSGDWHTKGLEAESEVKAKTWTCLEWMFDRAAGETRVWINNVEQLSLHTTSANYRTGDMEGGKQFVHPTYTYLKIGWWVYQTNATPNPGVVFIDELILDDEQIGCSL